MLVLLSPAKTLSPSLPILPDLRNELTTPLAIVHAQVLVERLSSWSLEETQKNLNLSDALAQRVFAWHQEWTAEGPYAAGWTFQGDAFKSLDLSSWSLDDAREASARLRILHGAYGILRPLDRYCPVRLEMGQPWHHKSSHRSVAGFWKTHLPSLVRNELEDGNHNQVLNLASAEYGDVALHGLNPDLIITCQFLEEIDGKLRSISAFAKAARGSMAKHVLNNRITSPADLEGFNDKGYVYAPQHSSNVLKVFTRTLTP
jgi:cytoplasmic iron level regulating protein YaaA (DUF328/UPF0246 family)